LVESAILTIQFCQVNDKPALELRVARDGLAFWMTSRFGAVLNNKEVLFLARSAGDGC
jgi:hypothetical protein